MCEEHIMQLVLQAVQLSLGLEVRKETLVPTFWLVENSSHVTLYRVCYIIVFCTTRCERDWILLPSENIGHSREDDIESKGCQNTGGV